MYQYINTFFRYRKLFAKRGGTWKKGGATPQLSPSVRFRAKFDFRHHFNPSTSPHFGGLSTLTYLSIFTSIGMLFGNCSFSIGMSKMDLSSWHFRNSMCKPRLRLKSNDVMPFGQRPRTSVEHTIVVNPDHLEYSISFNNELSDDKKSRYINVSSDEIQIFHYSRVITSRLLAGTWNQAALSSNSSLWYSSWMLWSEP